MNEYLVLNKCKKKVGKSWIFSYKDPFFAQKVYIWYFYRHPLFCMRQKWKMFQYIVQIFCIILKTHILTLKSGRQGGWQRDTPPYKMLLFTSDLYEAITHISSMHPDFTFNKQFPGIRNVFSLSSVILHYCDHKCRILLLVKIFSPVLCRL